MKIYNSATHQKEDFRPIEEGKVRMYVCGPTVYDNIHIGNARTFISFDVIRRWLIASGYEVTFAQNLTDVDDKIINRANEQGRTAEEVATEFSDKFIGVMRAANVLDPDVRPRATKEIGAMIGMIKTLIEGGHAYAADNGDVYFSVRSDPSYGEVSGRNIDDLMVGARIEENEDKRDPLDFALWKAAKPGEPSWKSPWGEGRPGWHTECAAMVHRYLGTPIDIHGGGSDLAFPHHARTQELGDDFKQFVDGVDAVRSKLLGVFDGEGVEAIDPKGEAFDCNIHQAVGRVEDASQYDETVNDVYQKGYRMGGKVLRPAMVTVTYGGETRPVIVEDDEDAEAETE